MGERYHLECFSGLAGDMFLGACLDLGMPLSVVREAVTGLDLDGVSVEVRKARRGGLAGTRFQVLLDGEPVEGPDPEEGAEPADHAEPAAGSGDEGAEALAPEHAPSGGHHAHAGPPDHAHGHPRGGSRDLGEIRALIEDSGLEAAVKETALHLFARVGEAEARAHGVPVAEVHFHEVGAVDSIVDLVGAAAAFHHLAPERLTCGRVNVGSGTVDTAHGRLPVPAPATAHLVRGLPVYGGPGGELLTPTGAAILAELVDEFTDLPPMVLETTGYGLGRKHLSGQPNAVRLVRGRGLEQGDSTGRVVVIEAQVDDLPAEGFGFLMERLLDAGALDVYLTPVQMKKNRPGTLVTVLCRPELREELAARLLVESGSLGCRYREMARLEAERETVEVETAFGSVRVKRGTLGGEQVAWAPEFEDCRRVALEKGVAWREVYRAALGAAVGGGEG